MKKLPNFLTSKNLRIIGICIAFLLAAILGISLIPNSVSLADSRVFFIESLPQEKSSLVSGEVAGIEDTLIPEKVELLKPNFKITANAVLVKDLKSGQIVFEKNSDQRVGPASTTKIMTALVASEYFKSGDALTVSSDGLVGGSTMGLSLGEKLTFRSLLYGMLLNSGNDAAFTIAANYPGGISGFVGRMNEKAKEIGLKNTHFQNPAGFDAPDHYTSASDMAKIAEQVAQDPQIARVFSTKETLVSALDKSKVHSLKNLNKLLGQDGVIGIKTGFTEQSGENLVALADKNEKKILTVVLNSSDRFGETKALMDWIYSN